MHPLPIAAVFACLAAFASGAHAADDGLDLSLPQASTHRNDPPGTFYGDTSGVPATAALADTTARLIRPACPTTPDGRATDLTGSVSAGVGYSSQLGNSNYQAGTLNWCKSYDGDRGMVNVQLNVGNYEGPDVRPLEPRPGSGPWPGPWPARSDGGFGR